MHSSRPRHSVLSLFDPLAQTPPRNQHNTEPNKENSYPPTDDVSVTAFFNRTYKTSQAVPHVPKRRLIDIGEMTIDDASMNAMLTDADEGLEEEFTSDVEDDENVTLTFQDMAIAATPNWKRRQDDKPSLTPRTPLGDLSLDPDATPIARTKVYKRLPMNCRSEPYSDANTTFEPAPNSVNSTPMPASDAEPTNYENNYDHASPASLVQYETKTVASSNPSHSTAVDSQLGNSVCTLNLPTSVGPLITDSTIPVFISPPSPTSPVEVCDLSPRDTSSFAQPRLRPNPPSTSSQDSNRFSIDLHSSFQLHMQSPDSTFDLLNDKISFFHPRNGMDGDDSFDTSLDPPEMEAEPTVFQERNDETAEAQDPSFVALPQSPMESDIEKTVKKPFKAPSPTASSPTSPAFGLRKRNSLPHSPSLHPRGIASTTLLSNVAVPLRPTVPLPLATPESSRLPPRLAQPIPGLRIIKRSKTIGHTNTDSVSNVGSSEETFTRPTFTTVCIRNDKPHGVVLPFLAGGVPALPHQKNTTSISSMAQTVRAARIMTQPSIPVVPPAPASSQYGPGPRRVLVSEEPKSVPATMGWRNKIGGALERGLNSAGPRRVVVPAAAVPSATDVKPVVQAKLPAPGTATGLKQPVKYVASATITSGLPKPISRSATSRLPAPSAIGGRKVGAIEGGTARSTLNRRF